jgi:hypothetical protein
LRHPGEAVGNCAEHSCRRIYDRLEGTAADLWHMQRLWDYDDYLAAFSQTRIPGM